MLVEVTQGPIEHKLSRHKLVARIDFAGGTALQEDNLCECGSGGV